MNKNKLFKVIWEVHLERDHVESLMEENPPESGVHDVVFIMSYDKMRATKPDIIRWEDEDGNPIRRIVKHHALSVVAGDVSEDEIEEIEVDNWEDLLDNPQAPNQGE